MSDTFARTVQKIKDTVITHGVYASYIRFTVLGTKYGDISFTTENYDGICCITSFENNKNGSGQANTFSLTIAFSPSKNSLFYRSGSGIDFSDINIIDKILNLNAGEETAKQRKCRIQYGYSYPSKIMSPVYEGAIVDYSVEIQNGILNYTITGYSGLAVESKDLRISIKGTTISSSSSDEELPEEFVGPPLQDSYDSDISEDNEDTNDEEEENTYTEDEDSEESENTIDTGGEMMKPTELVQRIYDKYLVDNTDYVLEWIGDTYGTDKEIEIETAQNVTAISYMKDLLATAEYEGDDEDTIPEARSIYTMYLSDKIYEDGKKRIFIERYDPCEKQRKVNDNSEVIRFSWMGSGSGDSINYSANAMVIDFKANFKGSVSMAYDYSAMSDKMIKRSGIDSAGELISVNGTTTPTAGANSKNDNYVNLNLWANRLQYAYTATLVVVGIPYEIKILENIYVAPMILGQEHHTGGLYKITKITDVIDGSGFTTSLELVRNMAPEINVQLMQARRDLLKAQNALASNQGQDEEAQAKVNELSELIKELESENGVD